MTSAGATEPGIRPLAALRDPLPWTALALLYLVFFMPTLRPLFSAWFPDLDRPVYEQDSFLSLTLSHLYIVGLASLGAAILGGGAAIFVTRPAGKTFRPLLESIVAMGQTFPPVAVLAVAVPLIGFGAEPAIIALFLYGLLPIVQNTIAGIESVPESALESARGLGFTRVEILTRVELPLAAPVIVAGIRTSVVLAIGTAAIASTVGAKTLGLPIIVGLNGFNTAYVLQGAAVVALLAVVADLLFDRLVRHLERWQRG